VALACDGQLLAFCEEERVTRVRQIGLVPGRLPEGALSTVLQCTGRQREDVVAYGVGEAAIALPDELVSQRFPHHYAHALTGFLTSSFPDAAVLVCDGSEEEISVWRGSGGGVVSCDWAKSSHGFATLFSECAALFGFREHQEHRLEGLARLDACANDRCLSRFFTYVDGRLVVDAGWKDAVRGWLTTDGSRWSPAHGARVAATFQRALGGVLRQLVAEVRGKTGATNLCLCGGLFFNTFLNTTIAESGIFEKTFVAPNPGNAGTAAGLAMASGSRPALHASSVSPFLGPSFEPEEVKPILDNCKLSYGYFSEGEVIDQVVSALVKGHLVGWFQGRMEWGHRALGNRSILASPHSRHVVENLNRFLKHRPIYTPYSISVCEEDMAREFRGPSRSTCMEYDYEVIDRARLQYVLPESSRTLRVQTVDRGPSVFRELHKSFGAATGGTGMLVNTSFNGLSEPIVCSPRDAIRVFFGSGLDLLAIGNFVLRK
jgi:carbamoyltransferase